MSPRPFLEPMLAGPTPKNYADVPAEGRWFAEEKYDGQRVCVAVLPRTVAELDATEDNTVRVWSRYGLPSVLPSRLRAALSRLPVGVYDGELLTSCRRTYGVIRVPPTDDVTLVLFDVLELLGRSLTYQPKVAGIGATYEERRSFLAEIFATPRDIELAWRRPVSCAAEVAAVAREVWARGGEGLVLKKATSLYEAGKRSREWLKIKRVLSATLVVDSCTPDSVQLRDPDGHTAVVEPRNRRERARLAVNPAAFIGRQLLIEHRGRARDGSYRHAVWDRWADE